MRETVDFMRPSVCIDTVHSLKMLRIHTSVPGPILLFLSLPDPDKPNVNFF